MLEARLAQSVSRSQWWELRNGPVSGIGQNMSDLLPPKGQPLGRCSVSGVLCLGVYEREPPFRVLKMGCEWPRRTKEMPSLL